MEAEQKKPKIFISNDPEYLNGSVTSLLNSLTYQDLMKQHIILPQDYEALRKRTSIYLQETSKTDEDEISLSQVQEVPSKISKIELRAADNQAHMHKVVNKVEAQLAKVNYSEIQKKFDTKFKEVLEFCKEKELKVQINDKIPQILSQRKDLVQNYYKTLDSLLLPENLMLMEELFKDYKLYDLTKQDDVVRILKQLNQNDATQANASLLLQILIIYNGFKLQKTDFLPLIKDQELILGVIWTMINPSIFIFQHVMKPRNMDKLSKFMPISLRKDFKDDIKILEYYCKICLEMKQSGLYYEQIGLMINQMIKVPQSTDFCKLQAFLGVLFEVGKGRKGTDVLIKFVKDHLLEEFNATKHNGNECEVCMQNDKNQYKLNIP